MQAQLTQATTTYIPNIKGRTLDWTSGRPCTARKAALPLHCTQWLCEESHGADEVLSEPLSLGQHEDKLTSIVESSSSAHPPLSLVHACSAGTAHLDADVCDLLGL